jgi:hypothetical protein
MKQLKVVETVSRLSLLETAKWKTITAERKIMAD